MDVAIHYQNIIIDVLEHYANEYQISNTDIKHQIVVDEQDHHYILLWLGWQEKRHIHAVVAHLDIMDDKIWIQKDTTEVGIANLLVEKGISKSAIVLAYFTPAHREYTEFAVA